MTGAGLRSPWSDPSGLVGPPRVSIFGPFFLSQRPKTTCVCIRYYFILCHLGHVFYVDVFDGDEEGKSNNIITAHVGSSKNQSTSIQPGHQESKAMLSDHLKLPGLGL